MSQVPERLVLVAVNESGSGAGSGLYACATCVKRVGPAPLAAEHEARPIG